MATRTCEGRPFAGAGVNLKSVSDRLLPASAAASFGSAFAGVKVDRLFEAERHRRRALLAARAGRDRRSQREPGRGERRSQLGFPAFGRLSNAQLSLFRSRYSPPRLKVP